MPPMSWQATVRMKRKLEQQKGVHSPGGKREVTNSKIYCRVIQSQNLNTKLATHLHRPAVTNSNFAQIQTHPGGLVTKPKDSNKERLGDGDSQNQRISAFPVANKGIGEPIVQNNKKSMEKKKTKVKEKYYNSNFISSSLAAINNSDTITRPNSIKGNLKRNFAFWEQIGSSRPILDVIESGYKIPFIETPKPAEFSNNKSALNEREFVTESIQKLLDGGFIFESKSRSEVINPLSVSKDSSDKKRLILDLRYVNKHLFREYIKFDDWRDFSSYISEHNYCYKFDLKQGYHHVDIFKEHQKYLGFSWAINGKKKFFIFTVLPFGLASAPFIFRGGYKPSQTRQLTA